MRADSPPPALLALPALLAFGRGGYFGGHARARRDPRVPAAGASPRRSPSARCPRSTAGRLALGGLAALTVWTGALAAVGAARRPGVRRPRAARALHRRARRRDRAATRHPWVEPALLATTVAAAVYGLVRAARAVAGRPRALPAAGDRLAQPLTYWNGQGALAAIGLVLAAGLPADGRAPAALRAAAAARPRCSGSTST